MIGTKLHWVEGPWSGKLAMAARPRGGDWLEDEMLEWQRAGVSVVVSFLEPQEESDLELTDEGLMARGMGMDFRSLPIGDRQVPASKTPVMTLVDQLDRELARGRNVVLHCRQGVGRTGVVAACLFISRGVELDAAIERLTKARGIAVPETTEQRLWLEAFAATLATAR